MRISDWSSDVCSSDLVAVDAPRLEADRRRLPARLRAVRAARRACTVAAAAAGTGAAGLHRHRPRGRPAGRRGAAHALQAAGGRRCRRARSAARAPAAAVVVRPVHCGRDVAAVRAARTEEHTSELQSLMRTLYAVFRLNKTY